MVPFPFAYTSKLNRRPTPFFGGSRSPQVTKEVQTATPQKGEPCVSQGEHNAAVDVKRPPPRPVAPKIMTLYKWVIIFVRLSAQETCRLLSYSSVCATYIGFGHCSLLTFMSKFDIIGQVTKKTFSINEKRQSKGVKL